MILLNANVLSELMRPEPNEDVIRWVDSVPDEDIWISAVTVAEIRLGLALLPNGRRKQNLARIAEEMLKEEFSEKCLPFDFQAADEYAAIVSTRNRQGRPITVEDAQIASIAIAANLVLATRNTKDFLDINRLDLINPWEAKDV